MRKSSAFPVLVGSVGTKPGFPADEAEYLQELQSPSVVFRRRHRLTRQFRGPPEALEPQCRDILRA